MPDSAIGSSDQATTITINGGCVEAVSNLYMAITLSLSKKPVSVIGGLKTSGSSLTVNGGIVAAHDSEDYGFPYPENFQHNNCIISTDGKATVYGDVVLKDNAGNGMTQINSLHIPSGAGLNSLGGLNPSTRTTDDLIEPVEIVCNSSISRVSTIEEIQNGISAYVLISGKQFTINGLEAIEVTGPADDGYTYTAICKKGDATVTAQFTPPPLSITHRSVAVQIDTGTFKYEGEPVTPGVSLKRNGKYLSQNTDFTVTYKNNNAVGTGTVTVQGIGKYTGTITRNFTIIDRYNIAETSYIDESGQLQEITAALLPNTPNNEESLDSGWYVVRGSTTLNRLTISQNQNVCLILEDGASLTLQEKTILMGLTEKVSGGNLVQNPNSHLTIYGQSENSGRLTALVSNKNRGTSAIKIMGNSFLSINGGSISVSAPTGSETEHAFMLAPSAVFTYNGKSENLTVTGGFMNNDKLQTELLTADMIAVNRENLPRGSSEDLSAAVGECVTLTNPTYAGKTFTLTGWEQSVAKVDDTTYTVTYTHEQRGTVSKTVTLTPPCAHTNLTFQDKGDGTCGGTCPDCKQEVKEPHQWSEAGVCGNCQTQAVAKVEKDGAESYYTTIETAWAAAQTAETAAVTLLADVTLAAELSTNPIILGSLTPNITFNGGNHTVTGYPGQRIFSVGSGSTLTITGGTFTAKPDEKGRTSGCVDVKSGGTLIVTDGTLELEGINGCMLTAQSGSTTRLSGGTFTGGATPVLCQDGLLLKDLLLNYGSENGPYYAFYQGSSPYAPSSSSLPSGTFTVQECKHDGVKPTSNHNGTHALKCPYCGYSDAAANCAYVFSGTTGTCAVCGDSVMVAVSGTENLIYNGTEKTLGVTVTRDTTELTVGTDYAVAYTDNTSAGTATVTVTIGGGKYSQDFTIGKATPTLIWGSTLQELDYNGHQAIISAPDVTLVNSEKFEGTISYSYAVSGSDSYTPGLPTNAGTYTVKASIAEQGNYTAAESTGGLTLTINRANQDAPAAPTAAAVMDTSVTLNTIENAEYSMDGNTWQNSPEFTGLNPNQEYTFFVRLKGDANHNASPSSSGTAITTSKTMLNGAVVTVTGTYTYNGAAIVPEAGSVTVELNGTTISSDQYTISASSNINAGKATLTVTATDNGNYSGSASTTFTINRAALTVKASDQTITYGGSIAQGAGQVDVTGLCGGDTLESVTLEASTSNVPGGTITPSAAVIKRGGEDVTANYNITYQPGALTINKSKPAIAFASGFSMDKTYDGQTIPNPVADNLTITGANFSDVTFEWSATPKDAGTYTLTAAIEETANTEAASVTLSVTISPKIVSNPTIELSPSTFEYDGTAKEPTVTVKDVGTVIPDSEYTVEYSDNINVGESATVTIKDKENGNYTVNGTQTFTITKAAQAPLTITGAPGAVTYGDTFQLSTSGGSGTGAVSWTATGATVDNAGNVTITSAGQVVITATKAGDDNYSEKETQITLTAGKKALTVTGATATGKKYDGINTVEITAVALDGKVGSDDVSVNTTDLTGTLNGSNAGDYTAVTLPALTLTGDKADNYTLTQPTGAVSANVTIQKADALTPKVGDLAVANKRAHTYTFGLGALLPDLTEGMSFGSGAVTYELGTVSLGDYYVEGAEIDGQTLILPIEAVESDEAKDIGTITIKIITDNFMDMTATINVRSVNKIIPTGAPALSAATITYGQPISTITLSGSMMDGEESVPGTFAWSSPENSPAVQDSYSAAWVFTPTDNEKYAKVNGTSAVKVLPAPIASAVIVLRPTAFKYDGSAHKPAVENVKLGEITLTADTDYTAEIPEETAAGEYTVTITGRGNYTGAATAKYTINPVEQKPLDMTDEDGHELRLEVETGLSTVPAALESNASLNTPEKITTALQTKVAEVMADAGKQIAVLDVTLQYKDESGNWHNVDAANFPDDGVTAILPYPEGTGASGYTFTVQHLISSGPSAGTIETLNYVLTSDGLKCKFSSLSPVAIGYKKTPSSGGSSGGGWYPSVSYYTVKVDKTEHGTVTASPTSIYSGGTVTLTVKPDSGYKLGKIIVTDSQGKTVERTEKNGKFTFKMPSRNVTVKADFVPAVSPSPEPTGSPSPSPSGSPTPTPSPSPSPKPWKSPFPDVSDTGWYIKAIEYVCTNGLMDGYANGKFGPNDDLTRAQFAQIIYNKEGRPQAKSGAFTDVTTGWYADAVNWAAEKGIVTGIGGGKFAPDRPITRQDLAVMLWRYAGSPEPRKNEVDFCDAGKVSGYAWKAICWANENGIVNGKGNGILDPQGRATRAETAQMLMNYLKK